MAKDDNDFGNVCTPVEDMDKEINPGTVIANTVSAIIFFGAFCFGGYIWCNYLL